MKVYFRPQSVFFFSPNVAALAGETAGNVLVTKRCGRMNGGLKSFRRRTDKDQQWLKPGVCPSSTEGQPWLWGTTHIDFFCSWLCAGWGTWLWLLTLTNTFSLCRYLCVSLSFLPLSSKTWLVFKSQANMWTRIESRIKVKVLFQSCQNASVLLAAV